ncbi:ABC transporter substrate-binding protein [Mesorhizobium muleiense]|uniref:NitT/TauT family transport system substrate-binding protein n=1 Tax=Mesorhizobium muleiense TaxID=1004279 RepID=A0A1G8MJM3_9HYPH|nr:ABC transporter substrate-binding protein [Mesorhizobium muleiense]MCF6103190.1 ABC transporter substrate-binding protein [Mesorhizobium muleiense]SDI68015.1 NitT/TauT family transport system substrate-binding protein [Mesorhizobium muleiense]
MQKVQSRRRFLANMAAAGVAGVVGTRNSRAEEGGLETTTVRLAKLPAICMAPQYAAKELLHAEGFTEVRYVAVELGDATTKSIAAGEVDFSLNYAGNLIVPMDLGIPITVVSGVHTGCFELFGSEGIHRITDLKGRTVGVPSIGSGPHLFLASMATYVGLDPVRDINWVASPSIKPKELFVEGKIDAFLGLPPDPQELRARSIGHVVVNSAVDPPWSQYFCCMLAGNAEFVRNNPVATKRVSRAILKAADLCVAEPQRVAQQIVDNGFTANYDYALQTMNEVPYGKWREYEPEDTVRFYALRLHEAGMIKTSPHQIIANGTDWRFLNELKRELKM